MRNQPHSAVELMIPLRIAFIWMIGLFLANSKADDLAPLSDEFNDPSTLENWQDLAEVEGWVAPAFEEADISTTESGRFHIVPGPNTWFGHLRGLLFFKEVTGDFVATIRVRVLSRHNPLEPIPEKGRTNSPFTRSSKASNSPSVGHGLEREDS